MTGEKSSSSFSPSTNLNAFIVWPREAIFIPDMLRWPGSGTHPEEHAAVKPSPHVLATQRIRSIQRKQMLPLPLNTFSTRSTPHNLPHEIRDEPAPGYGPLLVRALLTAALGFTRVSVPEPTPPV